MKTNVITLTFAMMVCALMGHHLQAQDNPTLEQQKKAITKLAKLMAGTWQGSGWMKKGQEPPSTVDVKETIELKNGGTTLLIQGLGTLPNSDKVVHDALAVVYYDAASDSYKFDSHLDNGNHKLMTGTLTDNVFIWGFDLPNNASIKYTITFGEGSWNEIGEFSPNGVQFFKFFEQNLTKTN